jgi:hypothetical protein
LNIIIIEAATNKNISGDKLKQTRSYSKKQVLNDVLKSDKYFTPYTKPIVNSETIVPIPVPNSKTWSVIFIILNTISGIQFTILWYLN